MLNIRKYTIRMRISCVFVFVCVQENKVADWAQALLNQWMKNNKMNIFSIIIFLPFLQRNLHKYLHSIAATSKIFLFLSTCRLSIFPLPFPSSLHVFLAYQATFFISTLQINSKHRLYMQHIYIVHIASMMCCVPAKRIAFNFPKSNNILLKMCK